jgi:uncharacterized membrane protein YraQ (UPF0718 family)
MSAHLIDALRYFVILTGELALLFVGISFLVGLLQEYVPPEKIEGVLGGNRHPLINNVLGAGFGALTPFCSCSTIPIVLGLLNARAQFGAVMSFLVASPLINPVILGLLTFLLGLKITIIYFAIIFPAAVLVGHIWQKVGLASEVKDVMIKQNCCSSETTASAQVSQKYYKIIRAFGSAWFLFKQMLPWLILGAAIGAFIYGFIPEDLIVKIAGPSNPLAIPVAAIIGIPMYIRTETMLPKHGGKCNVEKFI